MSISATLVLALLASFSGCTVGPDFSQPIPPIFQPGYMAKNDGNPAIASLHLDSWWQSFNDPKLNALLCRAKAQNLTLRQSFERIVEARSNLRLQGGQLGPNANLTSAYAYTKRSENARPFVGQNGDPFDLFDLGFDASWELDLFGKIKRGVEAADAEVQFQEHDYEYLRQTLFADIVSSYLRIRMLQEQVGLVEESLLLQSDTAMLVFERTEAGVATELDRSQTEAFRFRTRALFASLRQEIELEFNQLGLLLGQTPDLVLREFVGMSSLPLIPLVPEVGIPADLLRRRPDVWRDEQAVAAATARIGIAESDLYPHLSLIGSIGVSAKSVSGLFETNGLSFDVGPSLNWNILHFGRIFDNIEVHQARCRRAISKYQETVLKAAHEVENALVKHQGSRMQWSAMSDAIESDQRAVELSLERYKAGKASFQRVLDAQQQLLDDRRERAAVQTEAVVQLVRLYKAAGGGFQQESNQQMAINQIPAIQSGVNEFQSVPNGRLNHYPLDGLPEIQSVEPGFDPYMDDRGSPEKSDPIRSLPPTEDDSFEVFELENVTPPMPSKRSPAHAMNDSSSGDAPRIKATKVTGAADPGTIPMEWE